MVKCGALETALIRQMAFCLNILRRRSHPINNVSITIFHIGKDDLFGFKSELIGIIF